MNRHVTTPKLLGGAVHPITALDLPGLVPAPLDSMAEPIFDRIAPGDLLVDESYQRGLSARSLRLIQSIVKGWDWLRFKPPVVAVTRPHHRPPLSPARACVSGPWAR